MKKLQDESKRIGWASIKTTTRARQFADMLAGLFGKTIGETVEDAIVSHAERLATDTKDARGAALRAFIAAGGPVPSSPDPVAKPGSIGKAAPDLKEAASKRDAKRSKK